MGSNMVLGSPREEADPLRQSLSAEAGDETGETGSPAPSPFLPNTSIQFAWDSTSLGALKKCPRYYQYKLIEGWSHETGIHLRWGLEFHSALEDYERSRAVGLGHDDAMHDTLRALLGRLEGWEPQPTTKGEEAKSKENLLKTVVWYLENYNPDPAETVILANGKPAVEVSFQFELDFGPQSISFDVLDPIPMSDFGKREGQKVGQLELGPKYLLCGHLDRIVRFADHTFVMDHKTTTSTPGSYYFAQYEPNNQMTLYTLASQIILGSPIKGVIIDVVQIAAGFSRFSRGFTYRTADQLEEWLENTKHWLRYAEGLAADGFWPMNDTACDKFGGCEFRGICSKSPSVRQRFLESEFERREPWNPLKAR